MRWLLGIWTPLNDSPDHGAEQVPLAPFDSEAGQVQCCVRGVGLPVPLGESSRVSVQGRGGCASEDAQNSGPRAQGRESRVSRA